MDEFFRLDLGATISATIRALGYPSFRYKTATRVPTYLLLIERESPSDHQARLFDEMVTSLKHEGLIVTRYFYGDSPLLCYDELGDNGIPLERLKQRHANDRLLLLSSGTQLLDPMTGKLAQRVDVFSDWHERAVLTPESDWGWREQVLSEKFVVASADVRGLLTLADHIESPGSQVMVSQLPTDPHPLPLDADDLRSLDAVRRYLGQRLFQWLCACAIYAELQWELTLLLGSLPAEPREAVNEDDLFRLSRLPWFRKGSIPNAVRARLIESLEPVRVGLARTAVIKLLENSPPLPGTFASAAHGLELALQRWLLLKDKKSLDELRGALKSLPPRLVYHSEVLATYLKTAPHKLFGRRLPSTFYRHGIPTLGLSTLAQVVFVLALLSMALGTLRAHSEDVPRWAYAPFLSATPAPTPGVETAQVAPSPPDLNTRGASNMNGNVNTSGILDTPRNTNRNTTEGSANAPARTATPEDVPANTAKEDERIIEAVKRADAPGASTSDMKAAAEAYLTRGNIYWNAGSPSLYKYAFADFKQALKYDPSNREAKEKMDVIGSIYKAMGRPLPDVTPDPARSYIAFIVSINGSATVIRGEYLNPYRQW